MEYARHNDSLFNAQQFAGLPPNELWAMRNHLLCPECGGPAFYRKQTRNEREACFGARPHADWCGLKAAQSPTNPNNRNSYSASPHPAQRIVVDFAYGAQQSPPHQPAQPGDDQHAGTQDTSATGSGFSNNGTRHMRLVPLLRMLTSTPDLRSSQETVEIAGLGDYRVAEFFVPFEAVMPPNINMTLGFFGKITFAKINPQESALWLNFGGQANPSICVPWQLIPVFFDRFKVNDLTDLAGSNALVVGVLEVSQQGKWYVVLRDIHYVAIDLERG